LVCALHSFGQSCRTRRNNPWFRCRAGESGLEVVSVCVRADIPPGGRHGGQEGRGTATGKIEQGNGRRSPTGRHGAKKAAEANLIARREETGRDA